MTKQLSEVQERADGLSSDLMSLRADYSAAKEALGEKDSALRARQKDLHAAEQQVRLCLCVWVSTGLSGLCRSVSSELSCSPLVLIPTQVLLSGSDRTLKQRYATGQRLATADCDREAGMQCRPSSFVCVCTRPHPAVTAH